MEEDIGERITSVTKITAITLGLLALSYLPAIRELQDLGLDPVRDLFLFQFMVLLFGSFLLYSTTSYYGSQNSNEEGSPTENSSPEREASEGSMEVSENSQDENSSPVRETPKAMRYLFAIIKGILFGVVIVGIMQTMLINA